MDQTQRFIVGLALLVAVQILLGGTVVFLIRRQQAGRAWSWPKALGMFALLALGVTAVGLIPMAGRFVAVVVSLVGLQRLSGLDALGTVVLSVCMGVAVFLVAGLIGSKLRVDLMGLKDRVAMQDLPPGHAMDFWNELRRLNSAVPRCKDGLGYTPPGGIVGTPVGWVDNMRAERVADRRVDGSVERYVECLVGCAPDHQKPHQLAGT